MVAGGAGVCSLRRHCLLLLAGAGLGLGVCFGDKGGWGERRRRRRAPPCLGSAFAGTTVWLVGSGSAHGRGREVPAFAGTTGGSWWVEEGGLHGGFAGGFGLIRVRIYCRRLGRAWWRRRGRTMTVEIARQGGKNEISAQLGIWLAGVLQWPRAGSW